MTWKEMEKSSYEEIAEFLEKCNTCPKEENPDHVCVVDQEGDTDCKLCLKLMLQGVEVGADDFDDAKEYGRGYRV